jgi:hypothetical protein
MDLNRLDFMFGRDNGDKRDSLKWDFDEKRGYTTIVIASYPYKVLSKHNKKTQNLVARKLHKLRLLNDKINNVIDDYAKGPGIEIYKYIHKDNEGTSNYLLSEMKPSTGFSGLNKPKQRTLTNQEFVGADENIRARSRDIFLTIDTTTPEITEDELALYIHELAHTGANHVQWRPDDHKEDFKSFEELLWLIILKIVN